MKVHGISRDDLALIVEALQSSVDIEEEILEATIEEESTLVSIDDFLAAVADHQQKILQIRGLLKRLED